MASTMEARELPKKEPDYGKAGTSRTLSGRSVEAKTTGAASSRTDSGRVLGRTVTGQSAYARALLEDQPEEDTADHFGSQFVLKESCWAKHLWSAVLMTLLGYVATIFLYRFAFLNFHIGAEGLAPIGENDRGWNTVDLLVDILFWVDLFLNFFLSYKDSKGNEVDSLRLITCNYIRFKFWVNLLACIPETAYSGIIKLLAGEEDEGSQFNFKLTRVYRLNRLSRLTRITRLAKINQILSANSLWQKFQHFSGVRIVNFILGLLFALHLLACGWYLCAALHEDVTTTWVARRDILGSEPIEQWLTAMYWVLTVFTTVGFGDIWASTEAEMIYCAVTMMVGAVVHSIIISQVINIVTSTTESNVFLEKRVRLVRAFSAHTGLDPQVAKTMLSEITWRVKHWSVAPSFDKTEMKDMITGKYLPRWLISRIPESLFNGELLKNSFLHGVSVIPPRMPALLAMHVRNMDFTAGEIIYQMYDVPFNLYLVLSGTFAFVGTPGPQGGVDVLQGQVLKAEEISRPTTPARPATPARPTTPARTPNGPGDACHLYPYRIFSRRNYFGDVEVMAFTPRHSTARCERGGAALALHKQDLAELQSMFPQFAAVWKVSALRRESMRLHSLAKLTCGRAVKHFAATTIQRHVRNRSSCNGPRRPSERTSAISGASQHMCMHDSHNEVTVADVRRELEAIREGMRSFKEEMQALLQGSPREQ